ncbi:MAG TPA: ATP-binding protein, partial [Myxococcales bacterium]|nr:ATP-binding protein [Myxococcales bacterium]
NWKSFGGGDPARRTLALSGLTWFVGPNASGKSNALDALRFLQGAALDYRLDDVLQGHWEGQREIWPPIRGGTSEAARLGSPGFKITTGWTMGGERLTHELGVSITPGVLNPLQIVVSRERLADGEDKDLFEAANPHLHGRFPVAVKSKDETVDLHFNYSSTRSVLSQIQPHEELDRALIASAQSLRQALREVAFLDIQPSLMRYYRPESAGQLGSSGENISPVLAAISEERRREVVDWVSELCAPEIEAIDFDRTQFRDVMMILVERGGRRVSARSVSDGTLRFLGQLVALLTVPEHSLLVMEEPDVGLEPSRIRLMAEILETVSAQRSVQIIATTHSPTLLAHLSERALGDVVAFGRDPQSGDTICSRLADLPHFQTLREASNIEHLVSTGWLERAL